MVLKDVESSIKSIRNEVFVAHTCQRLSWRKVSADQAMERLSQTEKRREAVVRDLGCDLNVGVTSGAACFPNHDKRGGNGILQSTTWNMDSTHSEGRNDETNTTLGQV